jgi:hypothetical protein
VDKLRKSLESEVIIQNHVDLRKVGHEFEASLSARFRVVTAHATAGLA